MDLIASATGILKRAEGEVAALLGDAGKQERYDEAARLVEVAREIKELARRLATPNSNGQPAPHVPDPLITPDTAAAATGGTTKPATQAPRRYKAGEYPRFLREGESLVKIGWSKSNRVEYEHKCPRKVLPLLAAAIARVGAHGKRFTMDQVLPLKDDDSDIPSYQSYVALAWLRSLGLVRQHGRTGYTMADRQPLEPLIEVRWAEVLTR